MQLIASKAVQWAQPMTSAGVAVERVFIGPDPFGLGGFQVVVASSVTPPSRQVLRELFSARRGKTQIQLVVAVRHGDTTHMFGPDPHAQPVEVPTEQALRQLQSVLDEPDVLAATERLAGFRKLMPPPRSPVSQTAVSSPHTTSPRTYRNALTGKR